MRSVGAVSGKKMRGGGKSQTSCASDSSSLPNSLGCGSLRSKGGHSGARSLSAVVRSSIPQHLDGKQSCGSESVPPSTLRRSVKRGVGDRSLCVSAESTRLRSVGCKQSCASESVPTLTLRGPVKLVVDVNSMCVSAESSRPPSLGCEQSCASESVCQVSVCQC